MIGLLLLIFVVFSIVRLWGKTIYEFMKGMEGALKVGALDVLLYHFLAIALFFAVYIVIVREYQQFLPVQGVEYVLIPGIERLGEWLENTLRDLISSSPSYP